MRLCLLFAMPALMAASQELEQARDRQDRATLERVAATLDAAAAKNANDAAAQYNAAIAHSFAAEVATETKDKGGAQRSAEAGIKAAETAVRLKPDVAEYHRVLGTLCGQIIPANLLYAMRYGKCAKESIDRAVQLDPKSSDAYLSRGVGNYYLPVSFGGGADIAIRDFEQAIKLNPKSAEAYMWSGIALRKLNRNAEARQALTKAVQLNPKRVWAKQQLDKTPAK